MLDATAGVGPFAVRLAKLGRIVVANDLNPVCCDFLRENADLNKVKLTISNGDANDVILEHAGRIGAIITNLPELGYSLMRNL